MRGHGGVIPGTLSFPDHAPANEFTFRVCLKPRLLDVATRSGVSWASVVSKPVRYRAHWPIRPEITRAVNPAQQRRLCCSQGPRRRAVKLSSRHFDLCSRPWSQASCRSRADIQLLLANRCPSVLPHLGDVLFDPAGVLANLTHRGPELDPGSSRSKRARRGHLLGSGRALIGIVLPARPSSSAGAAMPTASRT